MASDLLAQAVVALMLGTCTPQVANSAPATKNWARSAQVASPGCPARSRRVHGQFHADDLGEVELGGRVRARRLEIAEHGFDPLVVGFEQRDGVLCHGNLLGCSCAPCSHARNPPR
jgi:hypothetical protein